MRQCASRTVWRLLGMTAVEALLVLSAHAATAPPRFSHRLAADPSSAAPRVAQTSDTITVIAGMVDFQPESPDNPLTTGPGTFDTSHPATPVLDAPPHAAAYFAAHLAFLQDYVATVSRGRAAVRIVLLPNVARMPKGMGDYAPSPDDPTSLELAHFVDTAWRMLDLANPSASIPDGDPASRFFVLFHAGVGRDIDLSSAYGYNPQPQDLPSIYFSLNALQRALGAGYTGTSIAGGRATVTNSAVVPETESRTVNGTALVLGINGVLTASFGSFLGLPDLFNTVSGFTAIGRFGLEDVASIFAFGGFLPPMPGAWERAALGWETPVTVRAGDERAITIVAAQRAAGSDTTCIRVPISDREYFLVENRERNPDRLGIDVYQQVDTGTVIFHGSADNPGFKDGDLSSLRGVITKCSAYDWSVAGSGIVIWHIDENIIDAYRADNAVNGSGHTHGVRVMEADGAQQIGVPVQTVFGTYISEGYDGDTWHRGNTDNFPGYSNVFSDTTLPSARANDNSPGRVMFRAFDSVAARMSFLLSSTALPRIAAGFPVRTGGDPGTNPVVVGDIDGDGSEELLVTTSSGIHAWHRTGARVIAGTDSFGLFTPDAGIVRCPSIDSASRLVIALSSAHDPGAGIDVRAWTPVDSNHDGVADLAWAHTLFLGTPRSIAVPMVTSFGIVCAADTVLAAYDRTGAELARMSVPAAGSGGHIVALAATATSGRIIVALAEERVAAVDLTTRTVQWNVAVPTAGISALGVGRTSVSNAWRINVVDTSGAIVELADDGTIVGSYALRAGHGGVQANPSGSLAMFSPAEGYLARAVRGSDDLFAFGPTSAQASDFPVRAGSASGAAPIVGLTERDKSTGTVRSMILTAGSGVLHAFGPDAASRVREYDGFPVTTGATLRSTPAVGDHLIAFATSSGNLLAYDSPFTGGAWSQAWGDAGHTSFDNTLPALSPVTGPLLPPDRVFNWPNPVRDKRTRIRFYVSRDATVRIRITNLANELVDALPDVQAKGTVDTEIEYQTRDIQSGVYIVRVEAETSDGTKEVAFTKMAVVN